MIDAAGTHVIYEVKHLEKSFGKVEVLKDLSLIHISEPTRH